MKTALIATAALALAVSPAMARDKHDKHGKGHHRHHEWSEHYRGDNHGRHNRWSRGDRLPVIYVQNPRYYVRPVAYDLAPAPYGYRWVLVEDDAYLARTDTGLIAQVVLNILR